LGSIYKRGKNWYMDIRVSGRRVRTRVGTSKEIATLALKDAEVQIARNEFGFLKTDISIDLFIQEFLNYCKANHQPRTTSRYKAVLNHFKAFISGHRNVVMLSHVTSELIDKFKIYRKDCWVNPNGQSVSSDADRTTHTRKGARSHTINFELGAIKTALNLAIKWGYLRDNPVRRVTKLKVNDSRPPRFLSMEECQRFLAATPTEFYPVYFTFLSTGMRKSELEFLEWIDIDFPRRKIKIRAKSDWQPKTSDREIPINDPLLAVLKERKRDNEKTTKSRYVFCSGDGSRLKVKLREKLIKIAIQAQIPDLTRVHTLRHTFASQLVMNGVDLPTVKKLMGHADIETTMIYAHLGQDHLTDAVNKLSFK